MKKIKIYEDGELLDELEVQGSFGIIHSEGMGVECYDEFMEYMPYNEQFIYRREYQRRAEELVKKYSGRLTHVNPKRIAFVVDEKWELKESATPNSKVKVDIARPGKFFALGDEFHFVIYIKGYYLEQWSDAQINAAIMSQLLRVNNPDGRILKYQDDSVNPLVATFGMNYLDPNIVIPDLLKEDVQIREFRRADGQVTIEEIQQQAAAQTTGTTARGNLCGECVNWHEESGGLGACNAEMADGAIADSHPACEEFYPRGGWVRVEDEDADDMPDDDKGADIAQDYADEDGDDHGDAA